MYINSQGVCLQIGKRGDAIVLYLNIGKPGRETYPIGNVVEKQILMPMEDPSPLPQALKASLKSMSVAKRSSIIYDAVYEAILLVMDKELNRLSEEHKNILPQDFCKNWYGMYGINGSNRKDLLTQIRNGVVEVIEYLVCAISLNLIPMIYLGLESQC